MERRTGPPRLQWQQIVESQGMSYHTIDGEPYWDETVCYRFDNAEIDLLETATNELHQRCIEAAQHIIDKDLFGRLGIPPHAVPLIVDSWDRDEPSLYGRFDLAYDGRTPPKLLEYNADTPTALLEASVIQWYWLQDRQPEADQFNSMHEKLIASWRDMGISSHLHFSCVADAPEDFGNLEYLRDTAIQAGLSTSYLAISDIGYDEISGRYVDLDDTPMECLFKLYPWEWLVNEYFGRKIATARMRLIEPAWKMLFSNKGLLAVLWQLFEGHQNLLPASFEQGAFRDNYVTKPLLSREGENVTIYRNGQVHAVEGSYGTGGIVYQQLAPIPCIDGSYPVIGSWVIGGEAAGIGIREDRTLVTTNASRFVPHYFT
ncbi:glutathionylspermidine synthase family protein [Trichlorobacter ammonificans]|uniref:Acid--amine ligase YgiC n=1 Tax=Trichlorobacter ammonificans TaxID=2916410 RepID=A0ABM9D7H8_9BACT|nr:glutathionylspermidine synthase family protein [Trichlorobacter ammonificans]CAH2031162.1 Putative acid--amine ligase YgiC [Trichlorobacter ammonificans]